jgi:hypothetical protein
MIPTGRGPTSTFGLLRVTITAARAIPLAPALAITAGQDGGVEIRRVYLRKSGVRILGEEQEKDRRA